MNLKNNKGITLITLVITIIVLLILAGVSIRMITGDDGIIARASDASEKTKEQSEAEKNKLTDANDYINNKVNQHSAPTLTTNEYGFYFNQPYQAMIEGALYEYIFYANGDASVWMSMDEEDAGAYAPIGTCTYEDRKIIIEDTPATLSEDGKTLSINNELTMNLNPITLSSIQYGIAYDNLNAGISIIFREDGSLEMYEDGTLSTTYPAGSISMKEYTFDFTFDSETLTCPIYPDGTKVIIGEILLSISKPILDTPTISLTNKVLSIDSINNATEYEIYIDGELKSTSTETVVDISKQLLPLEKNSEISVRAVCSSGEYRKSEHSNIITYSLSNLDTPIISLSDKVLTITPIENATEYEIYVDDELNYTTSNTIIDLSTYISDNDSCYIRVRAISPGNYFPSEYGYAWFSLTKIEPGLYDANDNLIASWGALVRDYGMNAQKDYLNHSVNHSSTESNYYDCYNLATTSPYYVLTNNEELSSGVKLIIHEKIIGSHTFIACTKLQTIEFTEFVTKINRSAFFGCKGLINLNFAENGNLTSIGFDAFWNCTALKNVTIPEGITSLSGYTFYNCTNLTSITFPKSITYIGVLTCGNCTKLTNVNFNGTVEQWNKVYKSTSGSAPWNKNVPASGVICTNGTGSLSNL